MLVLATSRIGFSAKILIFYYSAKNCRFSAKKADFDQFSPEIGDFSINNTKISKNELNRTIWWCVVTFFVIFHKTPFSDWYADFSVKLIHISLNFNNFSAFLPIIFKSVYWICVFGPVYSLFGPFLSELDPFLAPKVPFLGHFYIGLYIRKVRFLDIPGRTRMAVESRHAIIFSFRKKFW